MNDLSESIHAPTHPTVTNPGRQSFSSDDKEKGLFGEKGGAASIKSVAESDLLEDGTERPIETAEVSRICMILCRSCPVGVREEWHCAFSLLFKILFDLGIG